MREWCCCLPGGSSLDGHLAGNLIFQQLDKTTSFVSKQRIAASERWTVMILRCETTFSEKSNNVINNRLKFYVTSAGLKMDDGTITTDPSIKVEVFNTFFGSVFTVDDGLCSEVKNRVVDDGLNTVTFTPNIVRGVLLKLN